MMRTVVALLAITAVSGQDQADCALDSARAVDDIMDGLVYIMASIARCDPNTGDQIRCTLDVSAAIESVNKMVNIIVKAVDKCGAITTDKPECGIAIGEITRSVAAITSTSAGIIAKCPNKLNGGNPMDTVKSAMSTKKHAIAEEVGSGFSNSFGQCIINVKDTVKSLFKAVKRALVLSDDCKTPDSLECSHNSIKLVDAFVGMAEYIAGAVGKCSSNPNDDLNGQCAEEATALTHAVGEVGQGGTALAAACAPTAEERLYLDSLDQKKLDAAPTSNSLTYTLAARGWQGSPGWQRRFLMKRCTLTSSEWLHLDS